MRLLRAILLCALATTLSAASMSAQVDPRGKTRTLRTQHFRVHYPVALDSVARRAAYLAENAWNALAAELVTPTVPVELLIQDNLDLSNGFAQTLPSNRITIYATPPVGLAELRFYDDWMRLVITHELAHIFHIDRAGGWWNVGRKIFGRNPVLFPNAFLPSWVKEGLAVHYESKITGSGRITNTDSRMVAWAAAHAHAIQGPDAWSARTSRYPGGGTAYAWGSILMHRQAEGGGDSSMHKFVEQTATFPIPFLLNRSAKRTFGKSFTDRFAEFRDSIAAVAAQTGDAADSVWKLVTPNSERGAWEAAYPRWRNDSTLEYVASNGRDIAGVYRLRVPAAFLNVENASPALKPALEPPERLARRNSLDVNAIGPNGTSVFAQYEYADPYTLRSDLYRRDANGEKRLTDNARLIHPDVREKDGAIVAVQILPAGTRLVRVIGDSIVRLRSYPNSDWSEPRWDPTFDDIVAVQVVKNGTQRIVLLDTLGNIARIVAESRAVFSAPAFVPNSLGLIWASDRSGKTQLETAEVGQAYTRTNLSDAADGVFTLRNTPIVDTIWRAEVHQASNVSTGIFQPAVSSDGLNVAALLYRNNGFALAVAPFEGDGPLVTDSWYVGKASAPNNDSVFSGASAPYRPLRQLLPRYWLPISDEARDGGASVGAFTSGEDILGRHAYTADMVLNPRTNELNGNFDYQYSGLGLPRIAVSLTQDWDATLQVVDTAGKPIGRVARRLQYAAVSLGWSIPRVRWSASYSIGAQYERRHYSSDADSVLGGPNSALRTGTRYPSLFASGSIGNLARGSRGFSAEQGVAASASVSVRKRQGLVNSESWRTIGILRAYQPLSLPGFARHVLAARVAGGLTDTRATSDLSVGGVSGSLAELVPSVTVGDPSRTFPARGFPSGSQRGMRALSGTAEYRAPLGILARGLGLFPLFADRFSLSTFADAARAWCPANIANRSAALCEAPGKRDGWLASAGAELNADLAFQYDVPARLRIGVAKPFASPGDIARRAAFYVTFGAFF